MGWDKSEFKNPQLDEFGYPCTLVHEYTLNLFYSSSIKDYVYLNIKCTVKIHLQNLYFDERIFSKEKNRKSWWYKLSQVDQIFHKLK